MTDGEHPEFWVEPAILNVSYIGDSQIVLGDISASLQHIEQQTADIQHLLALGASTG